MQTRSRKPAAPVFNAITGLVLLAYGSLLFILAIWVLGFILERLYR